MSLHKKKNIEHLTNRLSIKVQLQAFFPLSDWITPDKNAYEKDNTTTYYT